MTAKSRQIKEKIFSVCLTNEYRKNQINWKKQISRNFELGKRENPIDLAFTDCFSTCQITRHSCFFIISNRWSTRLSFINQERRKNSFWSSQRCSTNVDFLKSLSELRTTVQRTSMVKLNLQPNSPKAQRDVKRLLLKKMIPTESETTKENYFSLSDFENFFAMTCMNHVRHG